MKLLISIEYRTRWGEQLVLRLGKRRIALQYADGGVWTCAVERYAPAAQPAEYRYEIERDGACIRSEWRPHTLRLPAREGVRTLRIRDRWQEMPSDTPFYSSAFTRGIFGRGKTGSPKKATGNITLRVVLPTLRPDETLAVAGSGRELGDWKRIVPMDDSRFVKNGKSVLDKLLTYQLPDGSFCHDDSFDAYATMQALCALAAAVRQAGGKTAFFTMTDVSKHIHTPQSGVTAHTSRLAETPAFTDTKGIAAQQAIETLAAYGVLNGMTKTTFEPAANLTRASQKLSSAL